MQKALLVVTTRLHLGEQDLDLALRVKVSATGFYLFLRLILSKTSSQLLTCTMRSTKMFFLLFFFPGWRLSGDLYEPSGDCKDSSAGGR